MVETDQQTLLNAQAQAIAAGQAQAASARAAMESQQALRAEQGIAGLRARQVRGGQIAAYEGGLNVAEQENKKAQAEYKAAADYNQALKIASKTENRRIEGDALCNLGRAYHDLGETSKAIEYYNKSLEIARKIEYCRGEGEALFYISLSLDKLGQRKEAINQAKAALMIFERIESPLVEKVQSKLAEWKET